jgi:CRP-like cAMP-binding protein
MTLAMADIFVLAAGAHADLLIPDTTRRVAATILRLGGWNHRLFRIAPPTSFTCNQETLAGAAALSRNTVGSILRELVASGHIETGYGRIAIIDPRKLRALTNAP